MSTLPNTRGGELVRGTLLSFRMIYAQNDTHVLAPVSQIFPSSICTISGFNLSGVRTETWAENLRTPVLKASFSASTKWGLFHGHSIRLLVVAKFAPSVSLRISIFPPIQLAHE
jgi:hypothetical protein